MLDYSVQISIYKKELAGIQAFLADFPVKKYKLNTGQSEQDVENYDIKTLYDRETFLINRISELENACNGGNTIYVC